MAKVQVALVAKAVVVCVIQCEMVQDPWSSAVLR